MPYEAAPQPHPGFRAKGMWVTFPALDLPPVGYRRYDLVAAEGGAEHQPAMSDAGFVLESRFYRVEVDPREGHIASIVDRESGRELVDSDAPFGFNEYVYDRYTSAAGFNHLSGRIQDIDLTLMGDRFMAGHAALVSRTTDAVAERLTLRMSATGADWLETTIVLPHDVKRIEIENRLAKIATAEKESVYFAFPVRGRRRARVRDLRRRHVTTRPARSRLDAAHVRRPPLGRPGGRAGVPPPGRRWRRR